MALNNSWNQDIAGYNARMGLQKTGIGVGGQVIGSTLMGLANGGPWAPWPVSAGPPCPEPPRWLRRV